MYLFRYFWKKQNTYKFSQSLLQPLPAILLLVLPSRKQLRLQKSSEEDELESHWHTDPAAAARSRQSLPTLHGPIAGSPPGCAAPGLSRQGHWSGLPLPSAMHGREKGKASRSVVPDSSRPHGLQARSLGLSRQEDWTRVPPCVN